MSNLISIKKVIPDVNQPRKYFDPAKIAELCKSIKVHGIISPIQVQPDGDNFLIVDGERRFRAAIMLGMKEIPIQVMESTDPITRMVEQFHLQQMHEQWTPVEEASVISEVMTASGKTFPETCRLLNINESRARRLYALSKLGDKEGYAANNIPLDYAESINNLNNFVRALKKDSEESFLKSDQKKLERMVISKIVSGEFNKRQDITKLKDMFRIQPKTYDQFLAGADTAELFIKSKAQATYHLRNAVYNCQNISNHIAKFIKTPNVELKDTEITTLKLCRERITELLQLAGKDE